MSSAARRLRRLQDKKQPELASQLARALSAVEQISAVQGDLGVLGELKELLEESQGLVERLTDDYQKLAREMIVQRETFLRLLERLGEDGAKNIRQVEAAIRAEVVEEEG